MALKNSALDFQSPAYTKLYFSQTTYQNTLKMEALLKGKLKIVRYNMRILCFWNWYKICIKNLMSWSESHEIVARRDGNPMNRIGCWGRRTGSPRPERKTLGDSASKPTTPDHKNPWERLAGHFPSICLFKWVQLFNTTENISESNVSQKQTI